MGIKKGLSVFMRLLIWVPVVFLSALLVHNAILYFTEGDTYGILPEKLSARQDMWWVISFFIHLPSGIVCLCAPLVLFIGRIFNMRRRLHRQIGKAYVWITLVLVCPTGVYLALYAKGGISTKIGFLVQAVLLAWYTYRGYAAIGQGNRQLHIDSMIRSYAMAAVVLSFRIYHILFFLWEVPYEDNYPMSQWLGIAGNMWLAETIIYLKTMTFNSDKPKLSTI